MLFAHLVRGKDPFEWTLSAADEPGDRAVPRGFEPVADAVLDQGDVEAAAVEAGRDLAADGVPLDELLTDLEATYAAAGLGGPDFHDLAARVEALRDLLESRSAAGPDGGEQRVWIEGLPDSHESASVLLDEQAR